MRRRVSCRTYTGEPLGEQERQRLSDEAARAITGPFGSRLRFMLVAAAPGDDEALRHLGTYGMIRGASAFFIGAAEPRGLYLEDFGWAMERLILCATELGLGTCWVGGLFTRGTFARRIRASRGERIPAIAALGRIRDWAAVEAGLVRRGLGADRRKPWAELFYEERFGRPLSPEQAGAYATLLEMVRLAPSARNRQPWQVVRSGASWHFFIRRNPGYPQGAATALLKIEDLQREDSGIAMCHFELAARELGLPGRWVVKPPQDVALPDRLTEYSATWVT